MQVFKTDNLSPESSFKLLYFLMYHLYNPLMQHPVPCKNDIFQIKFQYLRKKMHLKYAKEALDIENIRNKQGA